MTKPNPAARRARPGVVKGSKEGAKRDAERRAEQQARWDATLKGDKR